LVERQKVIEQRCEFYGHERNTKAKATPHPAKVGSSAKSKSASLPTRLDDGALETPSRVKMNA
jgi:hypothetical protein